MVEDWVQAWISTAPQACHDMAGSGRRTGAINATVLAQRCCTGGGLGI